MAVLSRWSVNNGWPPSLSASEKSRKLHVTQKVCFHVVHSLIFLKTSADEQRHGPYFIYRTLDLSKKIPTFHDILSPGVSPLLGGPIGSTPFFSSLAL